ncbi:pyridoxamine 5'-phosphate oxidase family protein [Humisphaera borealis]|uniref:Pyridoxamine 5'-phosphate oxidase family protein n=1 Tax=Humisphaera borealis TaxID=2807512 RepID=A0A7M2WZ00_9BACT|nr:pyridoxamine 5'-phosphate oxidase family protein [Humisphaera borealis]QOV89710.1 pyridoxamine 5'-phosphate oxidase family protein [Humisphaera borealis]
MTETTPTAKKLDELYDLIKEMKIALMTTRRSDGLLVTRPMATQKRNPIADLWFVTNIETQKIDELEDDPNVNLGYYNHGTYEWVSVSGKATLSQDRRLIRELHQPDWQAWFGDEGGNRNGGPDDPRLALILVDAVSVVYTKSKHSRPRALFEIAKGMLTGSEPDISREEHLSAAELR